MICRFSRLDKKQRKKTTINSIKKNYNKCFQCAATVAINYEKNGENPERTSNRKSFISKYNCKGINYPSEIDDRKSLRRKILQFLLMCSMKKKRKYAMPTFQNTTQIVKNKLLFY